MALEKFSISPLQLTSAIGKNPIPTKKAPVQLTATAMEEAVGRAFWAKSSVTKNQGMDPGPVANITTNKMTKTIDK